MKLENRPGQRIGALASATAWAADRLELGARRRVRPAERLAAARSATA